MIISENREIQKILEMALKNTTDHLARDSMRDYISKSRNMYWLGIKDDWDKYAQKNL